MIIEEDRLLELFETLPVMSISGSDYKPSFEFGSLDDLYRYLRDSADSEQKYYPLIWLQLPMQSTGNEKKVIIPLKLVLATLNINVEMSNKERLDINFKPVLIPLYNNIITAFNQSGFTRILNPKDIQVSKHYNFHFESKKDAPKDIWDAIKMECSLEMTDGCLLNINY